MVFVSFIGVNIKLSYARLAQWQSNGFVNRGLGVRLPLPAPETFLAPERFLWGRFCARARIGRQVHAL